MQVGVVGPGRMAVVISRWPVHVAGALAPRSAATMAIRMLGKKHAGAPIERTDSPIEPAGR